MSKHIRRPSSTGCMIDIDLDDDIATADRVEVELWIGFADCTDITAISIEQNVVWAYARQEQSFGVSSKAPRGGALSAELQAAVAAVHAKLESRRMHPSKRGTSGGASAGHA